VLELIKHIAGHFDELATTPIGMFKDELLDLRGPGLGDPENLLTHFPTRQPTDFSFNPYGPKYAARIIGIKPYYSNSQEIVLLMLELIPGSNFKILRDEKLTHNVTMVVLVKLFKRSDAYLLKNEADKGEFGAIALECGAECITPWRSLKQLGEIDEYDEEC
jgi:hypothetical protein